MDVCWMLSESTVTVDDMSCLEIVYVHSRISHYLINK